MSAGTKIKAFKCEICDYKTGLKAVLRTHIESVHKEIKKFECNICDYTRTTRILDGRNSQKYLH